MKDRTTEKLIIRLCQIYYKDTKSAWKEQTKILEELEKRGILNAKSFMKNAT